MGAQQRGKSVLSAKRSVRMCTDRARVGGLYIAEDRALLLYVE